MYLASEVTAGSLLSKTGRSFKTSPAYSSARSDERKQIQKLQTFYRLYGSTLEGSTSKFIVHQNDVPCSNTAVKKAKQIHKSKAEIIAEENNRRLKAKEEKKEEEQWKTIADNNRKGNKSMYNIAFHKNGRFF